MSVDILNGLMKEANFKENMFQKWRPKRPYESLVESLKKALERIDRQDIGSMVQEAFDNEAEFRFKSIWTKCKESLKNTNCLNGTVNDSLKQVFLWLNKNQNVYQNI